jgi:hypothetical protein
MAHSCRFEPATVAFTISLKADIRLPHKMCGVVYIRKRFLLFDGANGLRVAAPDGIDFVG